jgi:hypothetical protein
MYYHYRSGKWKVVDKIPAQIAEQKKSAAAKAAKIASAALIAPYWSTAALTLPAAAPSHDKLTAANLTKFVMEQLSLAMKAEPDNH